MTPIAKRKIAELNEIVAVFRPKESVRHELLRYSCRITSENKMRTSCRRLCHEGFAAAVKPHCRNLSLRTIFPESMLKSLVTFLYGK